MKKFTSTELIHKKWDEWERTWLTETVWMLCNSCVLSRPDRWGSMTFRMRPLKGEICPQPCNSRKWIKCNVHSSQLALSAQHVHLLKGPRQSYRHTILASCRYSSKAHKLSHANSSAAGIMERNTNSPELWGGIQFDKYSSSIPPLEWTGMMGTLGDSGLISFYATSCGANVSFLMRLSDVHTHTISAAFWGTAKLETSQQMNIFLEW